MHDSRGTFIVIEGTDGSGKSTQYALLKERLEHEGHEVVTVKFPRYTEPSSYFVREYLQGNYGSVDEVGPYAASLFFALDRYQATADIRQALQEGKIVLCDRFTASNMAHQGTKFSHAEQRRGYFIWLDNIEYEVLRIPRPTLTLVLNTPIELIEERLSQKEQSSTHVKKDIHEVNTEHIHRSLDVYLDLCQLFPKDFTRIDCARSSKALAIQDIHTLIWEKVAPLLPPPSPAILKVVKANEPIGTITINPYVEHDAHGIKITEAGDAYLDDIVTNGHSNVYIFKNALSTRAVAAALTGFNQRKDDLRTTILNELATHTDKDTALRGGTLTSEDTEGTRQLAGVQLVVEKASRLLLTKLKWCRIATYTEQLPGYTHVDQPDAAGNYRFHIPGHFDEKTKQYYTDTLHGIFTIYAGMLRTLMDHISHTSATPEDERDEAWQHIVHTQANDALRAVLPAATEAAVGIHASEEALESLIYHLLSDELPEARAIGQEILDEVRKVIPTFLGATNKPDQSNTVVAYRTAARMAVRQFADRHLSTAHASETNAVSLTSFSPRNELDIVADMLYEGSDQPLEAIQVAVDGWPYARKVEAFNTYLGTQTNEHHYLGRTLEKIHYSWDIVSDYDTFHALQRYPMVDDLEWQRLTPRHGYEMPELVEEAGLTDDFEQCFSLSLALYSYLQQAGYHAEAQYATLFGHRMRWKVTYNARQAFRMYESSMGADQRKVMFAMQQRLTEAHPLLAEHMAIISRH